MPAGTVFEPVSFLGSEPSHNLMAEAVKKSLQWSDFKRKVEHGDSRAQTALVGLRHIYPMPVCRFFAKAKGRS